MVLNEEGVHPQAESIPDGSVFVAPTRPRRRRESDALWVSGFHAVKELLRTRPDQIDLLVLAGKHPGHRLLVALARTHDIPFSRAVERVPEPLRRRKHVAAFARLAAFQYADFDTVTAAIGPQTLYLILDHLQDPTNLGNILRTAATAGVQALFLPKHRSVRITPTVAHIAAGALAHVPVVRFGSLQNLVQSLQERGVWVVAADPYAPEPWYAIRGQQPVAIVLGHEGSGIARSILQLCDQCVHIPMVHLESLNVATAAAVLLYEVIRQRSVSASDSR